MTYENTRNNPLKIKMWNIIIKKEERPLATKLSSEERKIAIEVCLEVAEQCSKSLPHEAKELINYAKTLK